MIIDCAAYVDGCRVSGEPTLAVIDEWRGKPDAFVWLGLRIPSPEELQDAFDRIGIDELDVHEVLAPHDRPVFTNEDDVMSLVLRTARYADDTERVHLGEMSVMVMGNVMLTVRHGKASPLTRLRHEIERDADRLRDGAPGVLAAIVTQIIEDYGPTLDGFERDVIEAENQVFDTSRTQPVQRLYLLKRQVRELEVAIDALHEPLVRMLRANRDRWSTDTVDDMHEAIEQLVRVVSRTRSLSSLIDSALDANLAQVSMRQNEDMRKISAWVAIAAVPTMIAGIYGMNFENLPELQFQFGYPLVLGFMAVVCGLLYRNFRRSGWL